MALIYNNDESINKPLYAIIVLLIYLIILIYIIILINSIYNLSVFFYNEAAYNILISEKENLNSKNITESYHYRVLNYINCFDDEDEKDDKNSPSKMTTLSGLGTLISANSKFSNEKDFSLLFEYNLYNIIFKIAIIIFAIIFFGIAINFFIDYFLLKKNYEIKGQNSIKDYIFNNKNSLIITITYIFVSAVFIYLAIYKFYFIDNIYNNIYNIYKSILQLDSFILDEANRINLKDKYFFVMLKNIVIVKSGNNYIISTDYENYIKENIENPEYNNVKTSKYLILGFYKYMVSISKDSDIINKLNNFIIRKNDNLENDKAISLRDFLPISIDQDNVDKKIDECFNFETDVIDALNKKKETLKFILKSLDDKLSQNDVVYNIIIYISILIVLNFIIVCIFLYFIYRNDYDSDSDTDKDKNFLIIKDVLNKIIDYITKYSKTEKTTI